MFNAEAKKSDTLPKPPTKETPARSGASAFAAPATGAAGTSVIGTDLTILGDHITIVSKNKLQVDGDIRGNVHGKHVVITEEGSVVGTVCAEAIEVRGGVRGAIRAQSVRLQASAEVQGDISHQKLFIAEGAEFDGSVHLIKDANELVPELDPDTLERARQSSAEAT